MPDDYCKLPLGLMAVATEMRAWIAWDDGAGDDVSEGSEMASDDTAE